MPPHDVDVELSSSEVLAGTGVGYAQLVRWVDHGVIKPGRHVGRGSGSRHRWSSDDRRRLQVVGAVLDDLATLGITHAPEHVVRLVWAGLVAGADQVGHGTVTIRLGLERS